MSPAVSGIVFDIKEFTLHDGPGLRTTVFLKGCPLDCSWCHNPEGKSAKPQVMQSPAGERVAGQIYTAADLAGKLNRHAHILRLNQGGVTFSGGEPLLQAAFLADVIDQLDEVHVLLDTSGYGDEQDFRLLVERSDLVYFDLKLVNEAPHRQFTGLDNRPILHNLQVLGQLGTSFVLRVPLIPGVTDTAENLEATARLAASLPDPPPVELLSYNPLAGAKYASAGIEYRPVFDPRRPVEPRLEIFARWGLQVKFHKRSGDAIEAG
jgi:pyruvate formate lyase activating enzyme